MWRTISVFAVALIWLVPFTTADAGLRFDFAVSGTPQVSINIPGPGSTVDIQVFLAQTGPTTILTNEGLATAAIEVDFGSPAGVASVQTTGDIQENPAFDFVFAKAVTATTAELDEALLGNPIVFPPLSDPNRILLGTFTFTGLAMGTTAISVTDLTPFDDIITGTGTVLDGLITQGAADVTVLPEPSGVALSVFVFASALAAGIRSRRRRQRLTSDSPPS